MKRLCEGSLEDALNLSEINILNQIIQVTQKICEKETGKIPKFLLIGMRALYFYFGREAFNPALYSVEIDLNFDVLMDWTPFRHKIPNLIKNQLELLGYQVKPGIGLISIFKEGVLIDLTVIFEYKEELVGKFIPELKIHAADKYFLIYSKLSRADPLKDLSRLKYLFKNCQNKLDFDKICSFASDYELELVKARMNALLKADI